MAESVRSASNSVKRSISDRALGGPPPPRTASVRGDPMMPRVTSVRNLSPPSALRGGQASAKDTGIKFDLDEPTIVSADSSTTRRPSFPAIPMLHEVRPPTGPGESSTRLEMSHSGDLVQADGPGASMSASMATGQSEGIAAGVSTFRCGAGRVVRVPFTVWTFLAMLVPIVIVVTSSAIRLDEAIREQNAIEKYSPLAQVIGGCATTMMRERGTMGPWLAVGTDAARDTLAGARAGVDEHCGRDLTRELRLLAADASAADLDFESALNTHDVMLRDLAALRIRVDGRNTSGRAARNFFTDAIRESSNAVLLVANTLRLHAREFIEIRSLVKTRNYIGLARGIGNAIAAQAPGSTPLALMQEYLAGHAQAHVAFDALQGTADDKLTAAVAEWQRSAAATRMWQLLDTMGDVDNNGVETIQREEAAAWWADVSAGLQALVAVEDAHVQRVVDAEEARADVRDTAIGTCVGVLLCVIAAGLLAWQQSRVRRQLERQVAAVTRTQEAVAAFVPKFFLKKMGYTSITQVRVGECTEVALAMLFSDIRKFTTVSEGMASPQLFDWVQGYFKRMTAIVDTHRGNVNQFIGDAMFAVFSACADALYCAIDMQADVQQLNVQRLCDDERTVPIEIGVGIHHDVVAMGVLGDEHRHTCTTIASSVNLASRLEGLTKQIGCPIIVSGPVIDQLTASDKSRLRCRNLGPVRVKGALTTTLDIYDVFQTEDRDLQQYKQETKSAFERFVKFMLKESDIGDDVRARVRELGGAANPAGDAPDAPVHPDSSATPRQFSALPVALRDGDHDSACALPRAETATPGTVALAGGPSHPLVSDCDAAPQPLEDLAALERAAALHGVKDRPLAAALAAADGAGAMRFDSK